MYDYERTMNKKLSVRRYNITIGLILLWGCIVNILMCKFCTNIFINWNFLAVTIGYFILCFIGFLISVNGKNPIITFIGYNFIVLPVGVILSIALSDYNPNLIMHALLITLIVTIIMIMLASIIPNIFLSIGKVLLVCLTCVCICEIIFILIGFSVPSIWDFIVALIFCACIGYDWAKAQQKIYTLDNAIKSVICLYLDIVNLFLRTLSSSSKLHKKS